MRKGVIVSIILLVCMVIAVSAYSFPPGCPASDRFCNADLETVKKFQKETLPLRDELITKRLEIRKEISKPKPDRDRIASLRKDIIDIQTEIQKKADDAGLPVRKCGRIGKVSGQGKGMMGNTHQCCSIRL